MLKINKITAETVNVYDPQDNLLGAVNEYEFLDLRAQIKEKQLDGYYVIHKGEKVAINKNGQIADWPYDLFATMGSLYAKLFKP